MPGGDRRGPMGAGAMSGRGAGFCSGSGVPGYMNGYVRGCGRGRIGGGRGLGIRRGMMFNSAGVYAPGSEVVQNELEADIKIMEENLELAKKRLSDLKSQNS